jgi:hypothetical protein
MANYVLVYHGGGGMEATPEEQAKTMQVWTDWFGRLGGALVDGGNPATRTRRIGPDGSVSEDSGGPSGYSIIQADSIDQAVQLAKGSPVLTAGGSVQVVETVAAM